MEKKLLKNVDFVPTLFIALFYHFLAYCALKAILAQWMEPGAPLQIVPPPNNIVCVS